MAFASPTPRPFLSLLLLAGCLLGAGCGSDDDSEDPAGGPTVAATTGVMRAISERVAGEDATVEQIVPDGSSPHDFQLSARDRQELDGADLIVENGAGLEAGLPLDETDVSRFTLADHSGRLLGDDPHVWMDPARVAAALPALGEAFAAADPEHAGGYRARARTFAKQLAALDRELAEALAQIPKQSRELVTSHDSLGYFADRYGFEVVATPFPSSGAEAEPSAATIAEVEEAIRAADVPTVFAQEEDEPEVLQQIAEETGVAIFSGLLIESPGEAGSYTEMLRRDAGAIRDGLTE